MFNFIRLAVVNVSGLEKVYMGQFRYFNEGYSIFCFLLFLCVLFLLECLSKEKVCI